MRSSTKPLVRNYGVVTFCPPIEVKRYLQKKAQESGVSLNAICIQVVKEYMEAQLVVDRQKELFGK